MKYEISIDSQWSIKSMLSGSEYYKFTVYQYKDSISYYSKHYFNSQSHGFNIITNTIIKIAQLSHMFWLVREIKTPIDLRNKWYIPITAVNPPR